MDRRIEALIDPLPAATAAAVRRQWLDMRAWWPIVGHDAPRPVWARRGYDQDGTQAWRLLRDRILAGPLSGALSVYLHVPFCERRCGFCDMYAHARPRDWPAASARFARVLLGEIEQWGACPGLAGRTVTTVHFGGGTPNLLGMPVLRQIVETLRAALDVRSETEWALESTSRLLSDEHLAELRELGFSRLHVGVQSLNDSLRTWLGRRESADAVLRKLVRASEQGFVVSADILYGLPGQEIHHLLETLRLLADAGLDGVSLYQLQRTERNRRFLDTCRDHAPDPITNYVQFQVGEHTLRRQGYQKTFFTHFSRPRDRNLYYSHVTRGEDLLAIGPSADGIFGDYVYRHPELGGYLAGADPALEGGLRESAWEQQIRPLTAALMNANIPDSMLTGAGVTALRDLWLASGMLRQGRPPGICELTANGSWRMAAMIDQLQTWEAAGAVRQAPATSAAGG